MKEVINLQGEFELVPDTTPVKTENGVHYLLSESDEVEILARNEVWQSGASERALRAVYSVRIKEYGTIGEQLDMIYHDGLEVWKNHIEQVKLDNPLP